MAKIFFVAKRNLLPNISIFYLHKCNIYQAWLCWQTILKWSTHIKKTIDGLKKKQLHFTNVSESVTEIWRPFNYLKINSSPKPPHSQEYKQASDVLNSDTFPQLAQFSRQQKKSTQPQFEKRTSATPRQKSPFKNFRYPVMIQSCPPSNLITPLFHTFPNPVISAGLSTCCSQCGRSPPR